jgi:catechol-2,3-dioxygenase
MTAPGSARPPADAGGLPDGLALGAVRLRDGDGLRMAVNPLDRDGLLAEAGESRWAGAPALTRMGHLTCSWATWPPPNGTT